MRIMHICLAAVYVDGFSYQENILPKINREDGHIVKIIASTETFLDNQELGYVDASEYITEYGVPIKRLPYVKIGPFFLTKKIRKYTNLYQEIESFSPDVVMCHDLAFWSVLEVIRYKRNHPNVKLYADTHTATYNSGKNWLSLHVLHRVIYRYLIKRAMPYVEKYFYIGVSEKEFSVEHYGVPENKMEFYPLGGLLLSDDEYEEVRKRRRAELSIEDDEVVLLHSGKLDKLKKTEDLLRAFYACKEIRAKLIIIGTIPNDLQSKLCSLMELDERVFFLGWKSASELQEYLCASDLYCQPGSVSATLQNAICRKNAILSYPHDSYISQLNFGNFCWVKNKEEIQDVLQKIGSGELDLDYMRKQSERCAIELLDYRKLAARLYR